jgi:hypothetical protein
MSISLQFDQVLRALANTVGVGMNSTTDPAYEVDKGHLYSKYVDSVNELFYEDGYGTITQITTNGQLLVDLGAYAEKVLLDAYAQKTLLDAYMVDTDLSVYALKTLLDSYMVDTDLGIYALKTALDAYAQKTLLDSYMVDTDLTIYAEKILLDGYIVDPPSALDGYVLVWNNAASMWTPQIQDGYLLQGRYVSQAAPSDGQLLTWNDSLTQWEPQSGDKANITWVPTSYTRTPTLPEAPNVDQLTAHLAGIDAYLGSLPDGYNGTVTLSEITGFVIENGLIKSVF